MNNFISSNSDAAHKRAEHHMQIACHSSHAVASPCAQIYTGSKLESVVIVVLEAKEDAIKLLKLAGN